MTFDLSNNGKEVDYINFTSDIGDSKTVLCQSEFNFPYVYKQNLDDFIICVERLVIPTQSIPCQDAINPAFTIESIGPGGLDLIGTTEATFSLKDFLNQLNSNTADIANHPITFSLTDDGRIRIFSTSWDDIQIRLSEELQQIFDLPEVNGSALAGVDSIIGLSPLFDRFDQLIKLQVESRGLNNFREIIDTESSLPILFDIIFPREYSASFSNVLFADSIASSRTDTIAVSYSYPTRGDVIYNTSGQKRFIMLKGGSVIQNLFVQVVAIYRDKSRNSIILPRGAIFEMKIAFYNKNGYIKN